MWIHPECGKEVKKMQKLVVRKLEPVQTSSAAEPCAN